MASVFLSYAREDVAKAEALAKALERAGHKVWWDRHIYSGSEFSGEIEAALKRADAVMVLWSKASVGSAWVRDEAAEGRDSDRLVPVVLDESRPPMGFRQFQAMDLSRWSGRGAPPHFQDLLAAVSRKAAAGEDRQTPASLAAPAAPAKRWKRIAAPALAVLLLALVVAGVWRFGSGEASAAEKPVLAVLPFADLSAGKDQAFISEGMAEAILSTLGRDPGIKVIGRTSSWKFRDGAADLAEIKKALGVTHVLEGSARTSGDNLRVSVRLIDASDGAQVWSEEYQRQMSNIFAVQDEIGKAVAQRLRGSFAKAAPKAQTQMTGADTYTLHLAARAKAREREDRSLREGLELARKAIAADPNYGPAHALYAELLLLLSSLEFEGVPAPEAVRTAEAHARRAIKLAPNSAEGFAALGAALAGTQPEIAAQALTRAIALDPARGELRMWLGDIYNKLNRNAEALEQFKTAVSMEPLWPPAVTSLHGTLLASDRFDEADALVSEFAARGGAPEVVARLRAFSALAQRSDIAEAIKYLHLSLRHAPESRHSAQALAWQYEQLGFEEQAQRLANRESPMVRLYISGRHHRVAEEARKMQSAMWSHPDLDLAAESLIRVHDWRSLAAIYDSRTGPVEPMCRSGRTAMAIIHMATAFKALSRNEEAAALASCVAKAIDSQSRGPVRAAEFPEERLALMRAQIWALQGNGSAALDAMKRAVDLGARTKHGSGLSSLPALEPLRSTPQYAALDQRLKQLAAVERTRVMKALSAS
ncbi:MAG TPA: TIR domain-containing protein [Allosphingosinicella sp.]|nr:TIR domain-containing protein [Allosphingosinicella sp.]